MNKLLAEFLGTFFICAVALLSRSPLATAGTVAAMVFALAYLSGGHFNPAVSVAVWLRGQLDRAEMLRYGAAQAAGAVAAVALGWVLAGKGDIVLRAEYPWFRGLVGESVFTFLVAFTYLHVRTARQLLGNSWFGITVGLAYFAGSSALSRVSGGVCNPALGLSLALNGTVHPGMLLVYLTAGILGGAAAAVAYRLLNPND